MGRTSLSGLGYLPGLDGLRAFAVLAVIVYHSGLGWLPGGFLGVEVFFVISGFIITAGLRRESTGAGISLRQFWKRRALRLLPAVALLLFGVLAHAEVFQRERVAGLAQDAGAALVYITNWYLIDDGQSYFNSFEEPSLLRHLWSLAIEEQFYLVWPLIALAGFRFLPRRLFAGVLVLGGIGAAILMAVLYEGGADISRLYYGTDTRASGLLLGAALALVWRPGVGKDRSGWHVRALDGAGVASVLGLVAACIWLTETGPWLYLGGFLAVDLLTIVAILAAVHASSRFAAVAGVLPLRWIGLRSYGLYLWHWPLILIIAPSFSWPGGALAEFGIELLATFLIAEASYRWLELPVRSGGLGRLWERIRDDGDGRALGRFVPASGVMAGGLAIVLVASFAMMARPPAQPDYFDLGQVRIAPDYQREIADVSGVSYYGSPSPADDPLYLEELGLVMREQLTEGPDGVAAGTPPTTPPPPATTSDEPSAQPAPPPSSATLAGVYVTAVGDSVMLGAAHQMAAAIAGLDVDAMVSRSMAAALAVLEDRKARGILADTVVLHIGNNGPITDDQLDRVAEIVEGRRTIIVSLRVPRWWEADNNTVIARALGRYGNFELLDWYAVSSERDDVFWTDDIHLRPAGAAYYTELLVETLANSPIRPKPVLSEIELPPGFARP